MHEFPEIRRCPDGSINVAFYVRRGRALHGRAVREGLAMVFRLALTLSILSGSFWLVARTAT